LVPAVRLRTARSHVLSEVGTSGRPGSTAQKPHTHGRIYASRSGQRRAAEDALAAVAPGLRVDAVLDLVLRRMRHRHEGQHRRRVSCRRVSRERRRRWRGHDAAGPRSLAAFVPPACAGATCNGEQDARRTQRPRRGRAGRKLRTPSHSGSARAARGRLRPSLRLVTLPSCLWTNRAQASVNLHHFFFGLYKLEKAGKVGNLGKIDMEG